MWAESDSGGGVALLAMVGCEIGVGVPLRRVVRGAARGRTSVDVRTSTDVDVFILLIYLPNAEKRVHSISRCESVRKVYIFREIK